MLEIPNTAGAAIVADLQRNRLYVFKRTDAGPQLIADHFVTIGKNGSYKRFEGDEKTPVGVYFVTSWIPGNTLPDLYGEGAFPVNYPNLWDERLGRTGSGIWIHGIPHDQQTRAPRSSRGCLSLNNRDLLAIAQSITIDETPVVISDYVSWVEAETLERQRDSVLSALEAWRKAWESRDTDRYLAFYTDDFRSGNMDRTAWARHKRRVNAHKRFIQVKTEQVGAYRYPSEENLVLVDFVQHYRSNNFQSTTRKRQYWRQTRNGVWRIVQEGQAGRGQEGSF